MTVAAALGGAVFAARALAADDADGRAFPGEGRFAGTSRFAEERGGAAPVRETTGDTDGAEGARAASDNAGVSSGGASGARDSRVAGSTIAAVRFQTVAAASRPPTIAIIAMLTTVNSGIDRCDLNRRDRGGGAQYVALAGSEDVRGIKRGSRKLLSDSDTCGGRSISRGDWTSSSAGRIFSAFRGSSFVNSSFLNSASQSMAMSTRSGPIVLVPMSSPN